MIDQEFDPEFDQVYRIDKCGNIEENNGDYYAPSVEHSDQHDILVDGGLVKSKSSPYEVNSGWDALTDHSGQDRYHGAVMHASELWGQWAIDDLTERAEDGDVLFTVVTVEAPCIGTNEPCFPDDPDYCIRTGCDAQPAGWAVLYRII